MKKLIHKLAIETPVIAILLVAILSYTLVQIGNNYQVDKYIEVKGVVQREEEKNIVIVNVEKTYLDGIQELNKVVWYESLDSAVYTGDIADIEEVEEEILIYIDLGKTEILEGKEVTLKISYDRESIIERLF